jgi:hypothetical protein
MWAAIFGIVLALSLPKRVERPAPRGCTAYQIQPFGLYLLGRLVGDLGVGYSSGEECR